MRDRSKLTWRLITIAVVLFLLFSGVWFLMALTRESKQLEQELNDRFGWAEQYVPVADGSVPPDRLERFVRVRQAVQPACKAYQEVLDGILGLDAIETDPELSGGEAATRGIKGFKSVLRVGPIMLQFMDARNATLLKEKMGLGEYFYLYLAAYGEKLSDVSNSPYSEMEEAHLSDRARDVFVEMLENQLAELTPSGAPEIVSQLQNEIDALEEGENSAPWPRGPLPNTRVSMSPYVDQLSDLYCDGIVSIELLQKNRGFSFEG